MMRILLALAALLAGGAPVLAQTPYPHRGPGCCDVEIGLGMSTYVGDRDENPSNRIGEWVSSGGATVRIAAGAGISRVARIAASYSLIRLPRLGSSAAPGLGSDLADQFLQGASPNRHSLHIEMPLYLLPGRQVSPYVSPGVGIIIGTINREIGSKTAFSPRLGLGVDVAVAPQWSVFMEIAGHMSVGDRQLDGVESDDYDVVAVAVGGLRYRFPPSERRPPGTLIADASATERQDVPAASPAIPPETSVQDDTAPVTESFPAVRTSYSSRLGQFVLQVDSFRVSDMESGISRIEYRISYLEAGGDAPASNMVITDWTTVAEPLSRQYTVPEFEVALPGESGQMLLDLRFVNGQQLPHRVRLPFEFTRDYSPPTLAGVPAHYLEMDTKDGLELLGRAFIDVESGISKVTYRVSSVPGGDLIANWTEMTGARTVFLNRSDYSFEDVETVRIDFKVENGHGIEESFDVAVPIPGESVSEAREIAARTEQQRPRTPGQEPPSSAVSSAPTPGVSAPAPSTGTEGQATSADATRPSVGSIRAYFRAKSVLVFVEGLASRSSGIERAEYRLLDGDGGVIRDWSLYPLVPPGKSVYQIVFHKIPIESTVNPATVEFRATNEAGMSVEMRAGVL